MCQLLFLLDQNEVGENSNLGQPQIGNDLLFSCQRWNIKGVYIFFFLKRGWGQGTGNGKKQLRLSNAKSQKMV